MTASTAVELDPIALQVLKTNLEAIANEGFFAIERTAITPVVSEALDCSCAIVSADGQLLVGGGVISIHFGAAATAVRSILAIHGESVAPGDVFYGNDPHSGIAVHAQDVMVAQPVFVGDQLTAWVVDSAHMIDLGGMAFGSWAPLATECYQEALRFPPVRLYQKGVKQNDVWAILRNNIRVPDLVEMDIRGLVAGCHVAQEKLIELVETRGGAVVFEAECAAIRDTAEREFRRRVRSIADGRYRMDSWVEWETEEFQTELYRLPCTLAVDGDRLVFDFSGSAPQADRFINSKPWVVKSVLMPELRNVLAQDLPLNEGLFKAVEVRCPDSTIVNSEPPAPVAGCHQDASRVAATLGIACLHLALAASDDDGFGHSHLTGQSANHATCTQAWRILSSDTSIDGFVMLGTARGSPAGSDRDGNDVTPLLVANRSAVEVIDVEVLESWYPILVVERRIRPGTYGAGRFRSGAGHQVSFRPHHAQGFSGVMTGRRPYVPFLGMAGGFPGATTSLRIFRIDGTIARVCSKGMNVLVGVDEIFEFRCASGGGYGDPLERPSGAVLTDVLTGRFTQAEAEDAYGVVFDERRQVDEPATQAKRLRMLADRLRDASPATKALSSGDVVEPIEAKAHPLYPGVVQRGSVAYSTESGAPLAVAPDHWTEGCPILTEKRHTGAGILLVDSYIDPVNGRALMVDVRLDGTPRSFETMPLHWTGDDASITYPRE